MAEMLLEALCFLKQYAESEKNIKTIQELLPNDVPIFKTSIGTKSFKIRLLELNYEIARDGSKPPFIDSVKEVDEFLSKRRKKNDQL